MKKVQRNMMQNADDITMNIHNKVHQAISAHEERVSNEFYLIFEQMIVMNVTF